MYQPTRIAPARPEVDARTELAAGPRRCEAPGSVLAGCVRTAARLVQPGIRRIARSRVPGTRFATLGALVAAILACGGEEAGHEPDGLRDASETSFEPNSDADDGDADDGDADAIGDVAADTAAPVDARVDDAEPDAENDGESDALEPPCRGISSSPESVAFGSVRLGETTRRTISLTPCTGTESVYGFVFEQEERGYSVSAHPPLPFVLEAPTEIEITYAPAQNGAARDELYVLYDESEQYSVPLQATGVAAGGPGDAVVRYELTWDDDTDMDIHMLRDAPGAQWGDESRDLFSPRTTIEWGAPGPENDPVLTPGDGTLRVESVVLETPEPGATYAFGFRASGGPLPRGGDVAARLFVNDNLVRRSVTEFGNIGDFFATGELAFADDGSWEYRPAHDYTPEGYPPR